MKHDRRIRPMVQTLEGRSLTSSLNVTPPAVRIPAAVLVPAPAVLVFSVTYTRSTGIVKITGSYNFTPGKYPPSVEIDCFFNLQKNQAFYLKVSHGVQPFLTTFKVGVLAPGKYLAFVQAFTNLWPEQFVSASNTLTVPK